MTALYWVTLVIHWTISVLIGIYSDEIGEKFGIKKEFPALLLAITISALLSLIVFSPIYSLLKH